MNGAQALINTLVDGGVDVCFANPGTSEMHFVAALDTVPQMRGVLTLFEGIATGAADGYARIAGRPAAVLLHLGPGLGNGLANLHNARRARVPMVVVVGDHATYHKKYDAPLESDIDALAGSVSGWVHRTDDTADVAADAAEAIAKTIANNQISTLILPADTSWTDGADIAGVSVQYPEPVDVDTDAVTSAAAVLQSGEPTVLLIGGDATRGAGFDGRGSHCRDNRYSLVLRDISNPTGTRRRGAGGRPHSVFRRGRGSPTRRCQKPDLGRCAVAGVILRLSRQAERPGARRLLCACARRTGRRHSRFGRARQPGRPRYDGDRSPESRPNCRVVR